MGSWGAIIMGFFGALFASLTLHWQWQLTGAVLYLPFIMFALIALAAAYVIRMPGKGIVPSEGASKTFVWSSVGEGVGLFLAANVVVNLHRPDLLLPTMALVVGLHFLPMAYAASFRPFYVLGAGLIAGAAAGFVVDPPLGGGIAGAMAALGLWIAAIGAARRDWLVKRMA